MASLKVPHRPPEFIGRLDAHHPEETVNSLLAQGTHNRENTKDVIHHRCTTIKYHDYNAINYLDRTQIRQIVINSGVEGAVIVEKVKATKKTSFGFNAATEEYGDLIEAGIIDPTKVTRYALQNAASIAGLMITTECLVADIPEEEKKGPMGGMPGGMGGMGGGDMY